MAFAKLKAAARSVEPAPAIAAFTAQSVGTSSPQPVMIVSDQNLL